MTVVVLTAFAGTGLGAVGTADAGRAAAAAGAAVDVDDGAGVVLRLGSALTVTSFPWVFMIAGGSSENLASNTFGRRSLASLYTASTAGLDGVVRLKFHYMRWYVQ